jgi:hypothetical protein
MVEMILGAMAMASSIAALFFLRFWRETQDRLFLLFSIAFVLLGITRLGLAVSHLKMEANTPWYWVRLAAFVIIFVAIVDKNRR